MREDDSSNWFSNWEDDLPRPEDLTPLSQTLISPPLALAFDIQTQTPSIPQFHRQIPSIPLNPSSGDFDSSSNELDGEPARTLKRPRLVWTPQLHKRFVDAVAHLGIKNAVPKTIMQMMSVDGLTRENVASHLQKYRQYLKRMQGHSNGGSGAGSGDAASDRLFASSPVPPHFLHPRQVSAMVTGGGYQQHHRWQFESQFGGGMHQNSATGYVGEFESGASGNGRRVLTLFPTGD